MKNLKSILVGLGLTASFALSGCGSSAVDDFKSAKDKVCACKDIECATKAWAALKTPSSEPSKSDMEKIAKIGEEAGKCMEKLREAAVPAE